MILQDVVKMVVQDSRIKIFDYGCFYDGLAVNFLAVPDSHDFREVLAINPSGNSCTGECYLCIYLKEEK